MAMKLVRDLIKKEEVNVGGRWQTFEGFEVKKAEIEPDDDSDEIILILGHGKFTKRKNDLIEWRKPEMT